MTTPVPDHESDLNNPRKHSFWGEMGTKEQLSCLAPFFSGFCHSSLHTAVFKSFSSETDLKMEKKEFSNLEKLDFSKRSVTPHHYAVRNLSGSDLKLLAGTVEGLTPVACTLMWAYRGVCVPFCM